MSSVQEVRLGQDELLKAIRERPEKVLAAFMELCDHHDALTSQWISIPLGTHEGVVAASKLQGEAQSLQTILGTLFDSLTEVDETEAEEMNDDPASP